MASPDYQHALGEVQTALEREAERWGDEAESANFIEGIETARQRAEVYRRSLRIVLKIKTRLLAQHEDSQ